MRIKSRTVNIVALVLLVPMIGLLFEISVFGQPDDPVRPDDPVHDNPPVREALDSLSTRDILQARDRSQAVDSFLLEEQPMERIERPLPFSVGERLEFKIYFEFILGGTATMSVEAIDTIDGHPCYRIVSQARSTWTVDRIYKVRDRVETYRDVDGGFSRRYVKHLREGSHRADKRVDYKPEINTAYLYEGNAETPETLSVEGYVQDVLSAFYEERCLPLVLDSSCWIDVHDIRKRYLLEVRVLRRERVKVPAGEFDCFVIEPLLQSSGIFRKEGQLQIWITDDQYRIPVLMKSKLYFGRVWAKLTSYRTG